MNFTTETRPSNKKYTDEEIEAGLREEGPLYIKEFVDPGGSLTDLVLNLAKMSFVKNTYNKKTNGLACRTGRKRSFCDLYCLVINYRPETRVTELKEIFKPLVLNKTVLISLCTTIKRGVFHFVGSNMRANMYDAGTFRECIGRTNEFGHIMNDFYNIKLEEIT